MGMNKRDFLKITGLAAVTLKAGSAKGTLNIMEIRKRVAPDEKALNAKRWAMVVDVRKCKDGCTKCQDACHHIHNVPHIENHEREIKWIWTEKFENAFAIPEIEARLIPEKLKMQPIITLCNHCDNPPCVRVCPTQATFKRKSDGVVMMDYHRCIGCRFCMAGCPYGSRSFNFSDPREHLHEKDINKKFPTRMKGVVEKCNFCAERLAVGQIPACVEACPEKALVFGDLDDPQSEVINLIRENFTIKRRPELGTLPMVYYIV